MPLMAKQPNRHKFPLWGVRINPAYRRQMKKLAEQTRRTVTEELKIALENHLKAAELWPPSSDKADK